MIEFIPDTLLANDAVTAIVGNRVKPYGTNEGEAFPYVTFQIVSDVPERCKAGIYHDVMRVQVSAFATTYAGKETLYKVIRMALDGARNANTRCKLLQANDMGYSSRDMTNEPGRAYGKAIDFQLITNS